jgi:hypothetical protein
MKELATFRNLPGIAAVKLGGSICDYFARMKGVDEAEWFDDLEQGGRVLMDCRHRQFLIGARLFLRYRKYSVSVMISKPPARVTVAFCPLMKLPPINNSHDFEEQRPCWKAGASRIGSVRSQSVKGSAAMVILFL